MNAKWGELWPFFKAVTEDNGYILLILTVPALLYAIWQPRKIASHGQLFLFFLATAFGWRILYSLSMGAGTRYNQFPVVLWCAAGMAGVAGFYGIVKRFRWRYYLTAGLVLTVVGIGIGKSLHRPKPKAYIAEIARILSKESPGILLDYSEGQSRLRHLLTDWEICIAEKSNCTQAVFWRSFGNFIQRQQGRGKTLYALIQQPEAMAPEMFSDACRREWGFAPFEEIWRQTERHQSYMLLRYAPPETLFGMPLVTQANPNPYGLNLPAKIRVPANGKFRLDFDAILADNPFPAWGGVECFAREVGQCFDDHWEFTPQPDGPREIPVSVTLFLPNGWPVGYAESTLELVKGDGDALPAIVKQRTPPDDRQLPPDWHAILPAPHRILTEEKTPLLWAQMANLPGAVAVPLPVEVVPSAQGKLTGTLFWIGSRCNGTKWLTDQLQKRNPVLKIMRLEEHPTLTYSNDPRYNFGDLATARLKENPLLYRGKVDWHHYCQQESVPDDAVIVIALGYEEVMYQGWQKAFHVDDAMAALRTFLDAVCRTSPQTKILVIAPIAPANTDQGWTKLSANPYLYGFRWHKRHVYRRLLEGLTAVTDEYPQVVLLPSYLFVPAGKEERYPEYLPAIERYLYDLSRKSKQL